MPEPEAPRTMSFVTIGARDLSGLRAFYESWGLTATPYSNDRFVSFELGSVTLAFYPLDLLRREAAPGPAAAPPTEWNEVTLGINVGSREEADALWRRLVSLGATAVAEPQNRDWGGRSGYVAGPEGNRWEIAWAPD